MSLITVGSTLGGGVLLAALAYLGWGRGGTHGAGFGGVGVGEELVPGWGGVLKVLLNVEKVRACD